jgi:hypothetical protein
MSGVEAIQLDGSFNPSGASREESAQLGPVKLGSNFRAKTVLDSERYKELSFKGSYFKCTQHYNKIYDFEGRATKPGPPSTMPFMSSAPSASYIPLTLRKPSAPYRLAKLMVNAFTALLLGEQRWPKIETPGDPDAGDYANAIMEACSMQARFIQARAEGGSTGTVAFSWAFRDGRPFVEVHSGKHLFVHRWADRDQLVPGEVSEVYRFPRDEWDPEKGAFVRNYYWHHRYWDESCDVTMKEVRFDPRIEPIWEPDPDKSFQHEDGFTHLVWCQNLPTDEVDGEADYDGLYENFDTIDIINSVLTKACVLNCDPTLVLQVNPNYKGEVRKGSEQSLWVGEAGGASYLELAGTSIDAGLKYFEQQKKNALDVGQCVLADPNEVAAQGISAVALKVIYAPMIAKCDVLREQYGTALKRLLVQMLTVVRNKQDQGYLLLPPRVKDGAVDPTPRTPGTSSDLLLVWGPYFQTTPDDKQKLLASLSAAAGGAAVIPQQTAIEDAATALGKDPKEEWRRYVAEKAAREQKLAAVVDDADAGGRQIVVSLDAGDKNTAQIAGAAGAPGKGPAGPGGGGASGGGGFSESGP